jgi:hypothetical protein
MTCVLAIIIPKRAVHRRGDVDRFLDAQRCVNRAGGPDQTAQNRRATNMTKPEESIDLPPMRRSLADEVRGRIALMTAMAGEADHKAVNDLVTKAKGAPFSTEICTLSGAMCGLLFMNHNAHNRPWNPGWSLELERRMKTGLWQKNSMSGGFYDDGLVEDLQHRLAAAALANYTLELAIVFGISKSAIATVDNGKTRSGADAAGLNGIENTTRKQQIVKAVAAYLVRTGDYSAALRSPAEVSSAIETDNDMLDQAIEVGERSRAGNSKPVLKSVVADMVVYLLLKSGWPLQRIREKLTQFQTGISMVSNDEPFYVAATYIEARRKRPTRPLSLVKEIAIAIFALVEDQRGVKAIQPKHVKAAIDGKTMPNPAYPDPDLDDAVDEAADEAAE